jgi:hypothetical protein
MQKPLGYEFQLCLPRGFLVFSMTKHFKTERYQEKLGSIYFPIIKQLTCYNSSIFLFLGIIQVQFKSELSIFILNLGGFPPWRRRTAVHASTVGKRAPPIQLAVPFGRQMIQATHPVHMLN